MKLLIASQYIGDDKSLLGTKLVKSSELWEVKILIYLFIHM